ncbi:MAG: hypothetical protein CMN27_16815 [Salinisphaera sp.]|nr:hypothetical protein [Salinisphaera sp.]
MRVRYALALVAILAGCWAIAQWPTGTPENQPPHSAAVAASQAPSLNRNAAPLTRKTPERGASAVSASLPVDDVLPSHEGTAVDGGVTLDNEGDLVVTRDLRRLFDYFLTGIGRASLPDIRTRLARHLVALGLPTSAQGEVLAVYDRYMAYRQRVADMGRTPQADAQTLADTLARREALRQEILGIEIADAFFADDNVMARYLVQKRTLMHTPDLTEHQREQRLAFLEETLPASIQADRERTRLPARAHGEIARMRAQGASDAEIRARREALLGPQAAQRLEQVDAQRAQWQQRVADYTAERARILGNDGLAPADRERALEALRQTHFNDAERRRIQSLEHIQAMTAPP